jgi:hypothetical protein
MPNFSLSSDTSHRLRVVPRLARSVGLGPVPFSPQGRFGYRPVHCLPLPVEADRGLVLQESSLPQLGKDSSPLPLLAAIVHGTRRAQATGQRLPLAACAQHVEDGFRGLTVVHVRPPACGFRLGCGQHFLEVGPHGVRNPPVGINGGVGFLSHNTYLQHRIRYS